MSHTPTEQFWVIPSGTLVERFVSLIRVKYALMAPNLTLERLEKLDPERKIVLFCGALVGVNVETLKVVLVKFPA